jgi:hypothetical protein|tara:strand:- start:480 stop:800 length:321 start_codon:yes stop_codon:yes gene_type:complete
MSISKLKNTLLFNINNENNFLSSIIEIKNQIKSKNIIINFNEVSFDKFLEDLNILSNQSKKNKRSFLLVKLDFNSDYHNSNIDIVPSLQEAIDVIEIEEIQRDLGI